MNRLQPLRVTDPAAFGHVAVLMGGTSSEREVSLDSGRNVLNALRARGVRADAVDGIPTLVRELQAKHFDRVFNILHGNKGGGEDGTLQGLLEALGVPYTGSGVLDGVALTTIRIVPRDTWYDYNAKYLADDTQYICPGLDEAGEAEAREMAERAYAALDLSGWARIDFMRDGQGRNWLLEANTAPGMTSHSLMPKSAAALDVSFEELCWRILEQTVPGRRA